MKTNDEILHEISIGANPTQILGEREKVCTRGFGFRERLIVIDMSMDGRDLGSILVDLGEDYNP